MIYQPRSVLYHLESQTPGRTHHEAENATQFLQRWGAHWWLGDEDVHCYTDGYKLIGNSRGGRSGADIVLLADIRDRASWTHVAATQAAAIKKDWSTVRRELSLIQDWPDDPSILAWAAHLCERLEEPALQQAFLVRYLDFADAPEQRIALIRSLFAQENLKAADQHIQKLLARSPDHGEGLLLSGILCMQREQYLEAETALASALRQGADRKKCLMGLGMASLGRAYPQGAWEHFLQVLTEHPDDAEAIHWLLRAGTAQNRWDDLSRQLRQYVSRNPGDLAGRFALAGVLVRADQIEAARREHGALCALAPEYDGLTELSKVITAKETVLAMESTLS